MSLVVVYGDPTSKPENCKTSAGLVPVGALPPQFAPTLQLPPAPFDQMNAAHADWPAVGTMIRAAETKNAATRAIGIFFVNCISVSFSDDVVPSSSYLARSRWKL